MTTGADLLQEMVVRTGGLVLTRDLVRAGLSDEETRWVTRGLHRIRSGAYALHQPTDSREAHALLVRAVILRHATPVAASHVSAAVLHGLPFWSLPLIRVHVTGVDGVRRGVRNRVHTHEGPIADADLVVREGIPVTSVPRTVMDCARSLPLDRAVALADHALHQGWATQEDLERRWKSLAPVTGVDRAHQVIGSVDPAAESPGESRTRLILVQADIPVETQFVVTDRRGSFVARVDLRLKKHPVLIEFDGRMKYSLDGDVEEAHWREKLRHDALMDAGYVVVRVTWAELVDPAAVVAKVRAAIARAPR